MKKTILCMVLIPVLAFAACGKTPSAEVTAAPSEIPTVAEEPA